MAQLLSSASRIDKAAVRAVLGPTNTGKTHLAIERLCAHSSGAIGFPLRLLAREVYDKVCAQKGKGEVALITGEERIEPEGARWFLCTAEAMPVMADLAFVAIDEAQLGADRERGFVFTDRLLYARGREETMFLGSEPLAPVVRSLVPEAEIVTRPRFSTLSHVPPVKLSRLAPRSAVVAFSAEQVYAIAELLRRFRGGAAVVMGALSPETRNRQVAMYESGEVDYIVATDAIGMGLNLDVNHVAFAGLTKFDGQRQRRLSVTEMAQIAGRAGRHHRDGTFGALSGFSLKERGQGGAGDNSPQFTSEEIYAIEEHHFAPLSQLYWREPEPPLDSLANLIAGLEILPDHPALIPAPEAIDLAVLRRLADHEDVTRTLVSPAQISRLWDLCRLPDFRQQGAELHARFVTRLWQHLHKGLLPSSVMAAAISRLDNVSGDIFALQGRIAAIRSWAYIAQRPDWAEAHYAMGERASAVEARLSDALHNRLAERFVSRRTTILMRHTRADADLLPVQLMGDEVLVDGETIGELAGFSLKLDPLIRHGDRKLLLAAADRHLGSLLAERARLLAEHIQQGESPLKITDRAILWENEPLARLEAGSNPLDFRLTPDSALARIPEQPRHDLMAALSSWLCDRIEPLAPLRRLQEASASLDSGPELRSLLITLIESGGVTARAGSGVERLDREQRRKLRQLGVYAGMLDIFVRPLLRPAAQEPLALMLNQPVADTAMPPVLPLGDSQSVYGYRWLGKQGLRVDMAEKLLREAHQRRLHSRHSAFLLNPALATSMGLAPDSYHLLLRLGGFRQIAGKALAERASGPPSPLRWRWRPPAAPVRKRDARSASGQGRGSRDLGRIHTPHSPFAALAGVFDKDRRRKGGK